MIDVTKDELNTIIDIIKSKEVNCTVYAFGSRCDGTAMKFSDLDLAFVHIDSIPLDLSKRSELEWAFSESDIPYLIDVVDFNACTPEFQKIISKSWVRIYPES